MGEMDYSIAKWYSSDWDSYPYPQGHLPHALTNLAISPPPDIQTDRNRLILRYYILVTSKVISVYLFVVVLATSNSGWISTCDDAHSWRLYSAVALGDQAASTITQFPIQLHYPDT